MFLTADKTPVEEKENLPGISVQFATRLTPLRWYLLDVEFCR